jgi:ribosomal protein S12 methylthiotransferase accessory factor
VSGRLRYVELIPVADGATAVRGVTDRWYRVAAPLDTVERLVREWDGAAPHPDDEWAAEARDGLAEILQRDGSLTPPATRRGAARTLLAGTLAARLAGADGSGILRKARLVDLDDLAAHLPIADVVLLDRDGLAEERLREIGRLCAEHGVAWAPVMVAEAAGWFGPLFAPGGELVPDDLLGRWATTARPAEWKADRSPVRLGAWLEFSAAELAWMAGVIGTELSRYANGEPYLASRHELELDPAALSTRTHVVLPLPVGERPETGLRGSPRDLVDGRTGVITRLTRVAHHPSIPTDLITMHSKVAALNRITPWFPDPVAAGTSFVSQELAEQAAIGEAVERYSGEIVRADLLRVASYDELIRAGEHAVDPDTLVMFSQRQYAAPGFPFVPMTRDLPFHWVRGWSLTRDCPAWLPASLVYGNWYVGPYVDTPHFNNLFHPGLAAGPDLDFAVAAGIQEVVERHATMAWWYNMPRLPQLKLNDRLARLWEGAPTELGQRACLIPLDNEFGIPVMAGVVENVQDQILTIGFAARPTAEAAGLKAWAEALTLQDAARDLQREHGGYRQAAGRGEVNGSFVKPWRADRRYLDAYRADFRDAIDLMCQLQTYLDPRAIDLVRPLLDTPRTAELGDQPRLPDYSVASYRRAVEAKGYEIFYSDITTRDVGRAGMSVVRVLVPGLIPNFAAAFPYLGKGRLQDIAVEYGWRDRPLGVDELNHLPLPHA